MRRFLVILAALPLAACTSIPERAARAQADMAQRIAIFGPACAGLGFAPQTDGWRACILELSTREELERISTFPPAYPAWGPGRWRGGMWGAYR